MFPWTTFSQIFSVASTIFMIWMLVDCIRNPKVSNKAGWFIFIIFTQFIGAAVYFFTRGPWPKVWQYLFPQRPFPVYQAPYAPTPQASPAPQPEQEAFTPYERGYQPQQYHSAPVSQTDEETPDTHSLQAEYEQPLLTYPDVPPIEQLH